MKPQFLEGCFLPRQTSDSSWKISQKRKYQMKRVQNDYRRQLRLGHVVQIAIYCKRDAKAQSFPADFPWVRDETIIERS